MRYFWVALKHKWYVLLAGFRVGLSLWQAVAHDLSKFSRTELPHYNRWFFVDHSDPDGWLGAWLHHQNHNPHHWEYWIVRTDHTQGKGDIVDECLPMPEKYVREMIADWLGASKAHTGSWDMSRWLSGNLGKMRLHPATRLCVAAILSGLG